MTDFSDSAEENYEVPISDEAPLEVADSSDAQAASDVLGHIVRWIVEAPNEVSVESSSEGDLVHLEVSVAPDDVGRVIGRRGRVANAIRTVVNAAAAQDGVNVTVSFLEP